jgi:benzoate-CoA ligase family protein
MQSVPCLADQRSIMVIFQRRHAMPQMNASDDLIRSAIERGFGNRIALLTDGDALTYAQLATIVNRAGNAFVNHGVSEGDRVLIMLPDSAELVSAYLGAIKLGAVAIAFNTRSTPNELAFALNDSKAKLLVIAADFIHLYQAAAACLKGISPQVLVAGGSYTGFERYEPIVADAPAQLDAVQVSSESMACWIYTSGTTGTPKAAVHRHRDILAAGPYLAECLGVREGYRLFSTSKLFFAYALGNCLFGGLRLCCSVILHSAWPRAEAIADIIDRAEPDIVFSVPTMLRNLLRSGTAGHSGLKRVRAFVSAGERMPRELAMQWHNCTGVPIIEGMGTSETIYMIFSNRIGEYRYGSAGKVAPDVAVKLIDSDGREIAEPGSPGVLWVKMPSASDSYWNQPEASSRAFRDGWFRTGDIFSFDSEGFYFHHGRADEMMKIAGQWVSPAEIEQCVIGVPGVNDVAVAAGSDPDGLTRPCLFVVPHDSTASHDTLTADIYRALAANLAPHKRPREIRVVDQIPRTATGKVRRFMLAELPARAVLVRHNG